jgi:hypothetical protein
MLYTAGFATAFVDRDVLGFGNWRKEKKCWCYLSTK